MPLHEYIRANTGLFSFCVALLTFTANASAEALDLNCAGAGGSSTFRLTVDPATGLVSNGGGLR